MSNDFIGCIKYKRHILYDEKKKIRIKIFKLTRKIFSRTIIWLFLLSNVSNFFCAGDYDLYQNPNTFIKL